MGLVGEHDYAVQDVDSSGGARKVLVKNPWCNGPVWTGAGWSVSLQTERDQQSSDLPDEEECKTGPSLSGTLWVSFEDIAQYFESMYLNWNPKMFRQRKDRHFVWDMPPKTWAASLIRNPQFTVTSASGGCVWILVSRHFVDEELDIARNKGGSMADVAQELGYMSIMVYDNNGKKRQIKGGEKYQGPLVDSPQTLARLEAQPGRQYTVVIEQCNLPLSRYTFTMSIFSQTVINLQDADDVMSHAREKSGTWNRRTAGGHSGCATYFQNPQFRLSSTLR